MGDGYTISHVEPNNGHVRQMTAYLNNRVIGCPLCAAKEQTEDLLTAARHLLDCSQASEPQECPRCHGDGEITVNTSRLRDPQEDREERCPTCHGEGQTEPFEVEALQALERAVSRMEGTTP